jgi:hexosaminidase
MRVPSRRYVAVAVVLSAIAAAPARADERPPALPALERWTPSDGPAFRLSSDARIIIRHAARTRFRGEGRTLARDLGKLLHRRVKVTARRGASARTGDIVMRRVREQGLGNEGYRLHVGPAFTITANATPGAFYGGRTLLQLVRAATPIPRGRARDVPVYAERGLMIDVARHYYSPDWLAARIRQLGNLKLNMLHLHLSDDQGFRIQSTTHPEVVTEPALTHADVASLVRVARHNHVTLIPEIDAPGHMTAALRAHPEFQLTSITGERQPDKLDVTNPAARRFYADLVGEIAPLFPGKFWHVGADEYFGVASTPADYALYPKLQAYAQARYGNTANGKDAVIDFVNGVGDQVRGIGKELRVWSDGVGGGSAARLDRRTSVEWWEELNSPSVADLVAAGYRVLNTGWWPNYYVTGGPLEGLRTPVSQQYEIFRPNDFTGPYTARWAVPTAPPSGHLPFGDRRQLGGSLAVWNDDPNSPDATEDSVAAGITPRLHVLAQRLWGSPDQYQTYNEFQAQARRLTGERG